MKTSDKRGDVMQAALELIAERGFHGAPMADIAKRAGVAAGTIYCYFESKDVLIMGLFQELEDKINATLREGYPVEQPLRERFLHIVRELLRYLIAHPLHFRYIEQYFNSPYGTSTRRDRLLGKTGNHDHDILMEIFEEGISQQILKDLPIVVLFSLAVGPIISLMRDHILGFIVLDEALIKQTTEAYWDAIKR